MTKPSQRHSTHVQSTKPGEPPPPAPPEKPAAGREKGQRGMWVALILWTVVFVVLFLILFVNLAFTLFRKPQP
jgi:hypothetical protein